MRLAIIESPYRGDIERNLAYLRQCIRDSVQRGESPYASHLILPGALDDADPVERDRGIRCGYAWWRYAHIVAFYVDLGWSEGMKKALHRAKTMQVKWEFRCLGGEWNENNPNRDP